MTLSLLFTIISKSSNCRLLMFNLCQCPLFFKHHTESLVITYLKKPIQCWALPSAFFHAHIVTGTAGYMVWVVAKKLKQAGKSTFFLMVLLDNQPLYPMPGVYIACPHRHATLDIALVTCSPSCLTASWLVHAKGKTVCGFPSISPWTSETVQWKLSMLQLISCRC